VVFQWFLLQQNLELSEIEAIVADIEREKEAGKCILPSTTCPTITDMMIFCRGGAQKVTVSCDGSRPGSDGTTGNWGGLWSVSLVWCVKLLYRVVYILHLFGYDPGQNKRYNCPKMEGYG
jgi:hypothetical protein